MKPLNLALGMMLAFGSVANSAESVRLPADLRSQFEIVDSILQNAVSDEKIVFLGETHKSKASFERVGAPILKSLALKGFDCLLLEWEEEFSSALKAFSSGASYQSSIYAQKVRSYGELGTLATNDKFEIQTLEYARRLGYRVLAIDINSSKQSLQGIYDTKSPLQSKKYLEDQMNRNVVMAQKIAQALNSRQCNKVLVVNGATHINPAEMKSYSERVLVSIPEILNRSRWKTKAFRLKTDTQTSRSEESFDGTFIYSNGASPLAL